MGSSRWLKGIRESTSFRSNADVPRFVASLVKVPEEEVEVVEERSLIRAV